MLAVAGIQLIEFFLWKNLKNDAINELCSKIASFFIILQQIFLMLMIPNSIIRYGMLAFYSFLIVVYFEYSRIYNPIRFHTSIGKNGHLSWEWMNYKGYENIWIVIFLLFYILPIFLHLFSFQTPNNDLRSFRVDATMSHLTHFIEQKNKQKCKNLVSIRLETDMNFKNLLPYKMRLVVFLYLIQNLLYSTYFAQHSYLCYELFRNYA